MIVTSSSKKNRHVRKLRHDCSAHSAGGCYFLNHSETICQLFGVDLHRGGVVHGIRRAPLALLICDAIYGHTCDTRP